MLHYYQRVMIWIRVGMSLISTMTGVSNEILGPDETVDALIDGKSLIRFGDGEFGIFRGKDIHYQKWSKELLRDFQSIKEEYEADFDSCPYLLALPQQFMSVSGFTLMKRRELVSSWAESRYQFKRSFNTSIQYGDAFLFEKKNVKVYEKLWTGENAVTNIVFVHNSERYAESFQRKYQTSTFFVQCPPKDAYMQIDLLEDAVQRCYKDNKLDKGNSLILISAGPAGKVLTYRLSHQGYRAIDTGHCWDDPLEGIY